MKISARVLKKVKAVPAARRKEATPPNMDKMEAKLIRMFEEVRREAVKRIDAFLNERIERRLQEYDSGTRSAVGKEFKKYFDQNLNAWLSERFEVTLLPFTTPFKDIKAMIEKGWRVLDLDKCRGLVLQRSKGKSEATKSCTSTNQPSGVPAVKKAFPKIGMKKASASAPTATARGLRVKTGA